MQKQTKTTLIAVMALVILAVTFAAIYFLTRPATEEGEKALHIEVIVGGETVRTLDFRTDAEYLRGALEEQDLIQGDESSLGLWVKTVNGRTVDDGKQEWWCFTKGGAQLDYGVDEIVVADGDKFEITLMVGW